MRHPLLCAIILFVGAAAPCAAARTGDLYERPIDPLTDSFSRTTIHWTGKGYEGETMLVYGVVQHEDRIAVCGLHMSKGAYSRDALMNGLRLSSVTSGGHTLVEDLSYFDEFAGERDFFRFVCRVTKFRWNPAFARIKPKFVQGVEFYVPPN